MSALKFQPSLVVMLNNPQGRKEVESCLADTLCEQGFVKESYKDAILAREETFPTGLDVQGINAAIPHCDPQRVNEGAMCVGVLKHPVSWQRMDDKNASCDVSLVVMLALTDPKEHLVVLRKVVKLIQGQELVRRIVDCDSSEEAFELLESALG